MSDVFISYSRKDIAFARLIQESLQSSQVDTWIDWERIPVGERWWEEIRSAIQQANVFMFIISQNSIGSAVCKDEIHLALQNHKRIIPIIVDQLTPEAVRDFVPELPQFNWIIFERDNNFRLEENPTAASEKPEDKLVAFPRLPQFQEALERLSAAIHTDWVWVKTHTRLQVDALRWEANGKNASYLLRGVELEEAEAGLFRAAGKDPQPTSLQVEYVTTSRQEETQRQEERLNLEKKARQRQRLALWAVGGGLVLAIVLGALAWTQRNKFQAETHVRATAEANALAQRATAESEAQARATQEAIAIQQRNEAEVQARKALAGKLDTEMTVLLGKQNDLALLLGLEAYSTFPDPESQGSLLNGLLTSSRLIHTLHGTQTTVSALAYSPDGTTLAVDGCGLQDESFVCHYSESNLWDTSTGKMIGKLTGDAGTAAAAAIGFSRDGSRLYTVSRRGNVVIWDIKTGQALEKIRWHDRYLTVAAFQPSGSLIALGECSKVAEGIEAQFMCGPGEVEFWDTASKQPSKVTFTGISAVPSALAFSPDGKWLAIADYDHELVLLDVVTGETTTLLEASPSGFISSLAFGPNSSVLVTGDSTDTVSFLSPADGSTVFPSIKLTERLDGLALSPDGATLVTSTEAGLTFWEVQTGKQIGPQLKGYPAYTGNLLMSPDGKTVAGGIQPVYLWSMQNDQPLTSKPTIDQEFEPLAFSPDGTRLVMGGYLSNHMFLWDTVHKIGIAAQEDLPNTVDQARFTPDGRSFYTYNPEAGIVQWDGETGKQMRSFLNDYTDGMYHSVFSPDGRYLASQSNAGTHIWEAETGKLHSTMPYIPETYSSPAFSLDGRWIAIGGCAAGSVSQGKNGISQCAQGEAGILDVDSGAEILRLSASLPRDYVRGMAFSTDGHSLALSSAHLIQVWDLISPPKLRQTIDLTSFESVKDLLGLPTLLAFSPDGTVLAVGQQFPSTVALLSLETGTLLADPIPADYNLHSLGFTPDGRNVIAGSDVPYQIDLSTKPLKALPFEPTEDAGLDDIISSLAISPDGKTLAAGSMASAITLWDLSASAPVKLTTLYGHSDQITALAFSPDGKTLHSASLDMTLDRWDVAEGTLIDQPLRGYRENSRARGAFSPNGERVATSSCRIKGEAQTCPDTEINIWETATGNNLLEFHGPYEIFTLAFSPDARWLADSSAEKPGSNEVKGSVAVHLWDLSVDPPAPRTLVQGMDNVVDRLVFSPDGTYLVGLSNRRVYLWDTATGEAGELPTSIQSQYFVSAAFDPSGQLLALGSASGIQLFDLASGQLIGPTMNTLASSQAARNDRILFGPDGKTLAGGGPVTIWNVDVVEWIARACDIADRNLTEEEWKTYIGDAAYRKTCP